MNLHPFHTVHRACALGVLAMLATLAAPPAPAQTAELPTTPALASLGARLVPPASPAVRLRQVNFAFDSGRLADSDWGRADIDAAALRAAIGPAGGYVNVVLHAPGVGPVWAVENLRIVPEGLAARDGITQAMLAAEGLPSQQPAVPMAAYFDLRPGVRGAGRLGAAYASVVASSAPLPALDRVWSLLRQAPPAAWAVTPVDENPQGDLGADGPQRARTTLSAGVGEPPAPVQPRPETPGDLAFADEVLQAAQPNLQAAKNQCVPMAHANVVGYLRLRYNHLPLSWPMPHHSMPGLGRTMSAGDVIFWQPDPTISRVSQIDARTRRTGVYDFDHGGGSTRCQSMRGVMSYFATQTVPGQVSFRHQGGHALYGAGGTCDGDPTLPLAALQSAREGNEVTWDWLRQQLAAGRGVYMSYGRYDAAGERTGGHAVRVWGVRRFNGKHYVMTLDDSSQGLNNSGLRTVQYGVSDLTRPGAPGVPNGRLELDGGSSEIEFAFSVQAHPTLLIP